MGRPRLKGKRLPNLSVLTEDPRTAWKLPTIPSWYGERKRMVEVVASETAVLVQSTGLFAVPLRSGFWCAIRRVSSKPRPFCVYRP